ncbi:MAG TPA: hypothetical protein VHG11_04065, partial [Pseudorhizobium sp.]|nr:hypothetical protein [Pseudorhizobium sp.]
MADNSLARNRNDGPDFFADDDPLAELARVVGYDERLVPKPPVAERREPAFNLEDELLREFERYEAPRPHQPASLSANAVTDLAPVEVSEVAPLVAEQGEADMSTAAFHERNQSSGAAEPAWMGELQSSGTASGEDRLGDAQARVEEPGNAFVQDIALVAGNGNDAEVAFSHLDEAASSEVASSPDPSAAVAPNAVAVEPVRDEVAAPTLDLSDELELALGAVQVPQPEPESRSQRKPIYTPGFRMPLANFNPVNDAPRAQPLREQPPQRVEPLFDEVSEPLEVAPLLPSAEPVGTELAEPPVLEASKAAPAQELVADSFDGHLIEPQAPVAHEAFVVTPELPASEHVTVEADTQFLADSSPVVEPARPVISEPRLDLPFHLKADPFSPMSPVAPNVAAPRAPAAEEPGLDEDFELALDDL